mgnify:CR=1 FL=1
MKFLEQIFTGINIRKLIVTSVFSSIVGLIVIGIYSQLARNGWELFYRSYEIKVDMSIARVALLFIFLMVISLIIGLFISKFRKLTILEANYGVKGKYTDITPELTEFISSNRLNIRLSNGITGGYDPAPHIYKHAVIKYAYGRKKNKVTINEGDRIVLP